MLVSEVMHKGVTTVQIHDSIKKVANLMKREDIGSVPVYKNERPVGFVTDRDIVVSCIAQGHDSNESISHAMRSEIFSIHENADVEAATTLMQEKQISRLLVLDRGEKPVGMLTLHDLASYGVQDRLTASTLNNIKKN